MCSRLAKAPRTKDAGRTHGEQIGPEVELDVTEQTFAPRTRGEQIGPDVEIDVIEQTLPLAHAELDVVVTVVTVELGVLVVTLTVTLTLTAVECVRLSSLRGFWMVGMDPDLRNLLKCMPPSCPNFICAG